LFKELRELWIFEESGAEAIVKSRHGLQEIIQDDLGELNMGAIDLISLGNCGFIIYHGVIFG